MLDAFDKTSGLIAILAGVAIAANMVWRMEYPNTPKHPVTLASIVFVISMAISVFLPTTKQMAVIIVAPKIVNNEAIQTIPGKLVDLSNAWLDELKPKKEVPNE